MLGLVGHRQSIGSWTFSSGSFTLRAEPSERLVQEGQMVGYKHHSFWSCMGTLRENTYLEDLWQSGQVTWKMW